LLPGKGRRACIPAALVLLLVVACAGPASASATSFHFESSPTWLKGEQASTNVFGFSGGKIKATMATFRSGEILGTSAGAVTVHPEYGGISAFGLEALVSTAGCNYVLEPSSVSAGDLGIVCEEGHEIGFTVPKARCSIHIPPQIPGTPTVKFAGSGSGATRNLLLTFEVGGLTYTATGSVCGESGSNGTLTGSATIKGFGTSSFTSQHGIWIE
jgi:hypothetical protein